MIKDLPFGWISKNAKFTQQKQKEYSFFLETWLKSKEKSPRELYTALKNFVQYLELLEETCKNKGECFEFWYYEILTSKNYLINRREELRELETNLESLQKNYEKRLALIVNIDFKIVELLRQNDNILQTDFIKLFDECIHDDIKKKLYYMEKDGKLERLKKGKSYILHCKC